MLYSFMGTYHTLTSDDVLLQPVMIRGICKKQWKNTVLLKTWLLIRTWDGPRSLDVPLEKFGRGWHIKLGARLPFAWNLFLILGNYPHIIRDYLVKLSSYYPDHLVTLSWWSRLHSPLLGMNSLTHSPLAAAIPLQRDWFNIKYIHVMTS